MPEDLGDPIGADFEVAGELGDGGASAMSRLEVVSGVDDPVQEVTGVNGQAYSAAAIGDAAGDGLADPPGGVGGELEAFAPVELLDGVHEPEVALLNQVEQRQLGRPVLLGDRHDQAEIAVGKSLHGRLSRPFDPVQLAHAGWADPSER